MIIKENVLEIKDKTTVELKSFTTFSGEQIKESNSKTSEIGSTETLTESRYSKWWIELKHSFHEKIETFDLEGQVIDEDRDQKGLSPRHVALIAIAGGLGTGLLVGNGKALSMGGPLGLVISYVIVGVMLFSTILAAGELAVSFSGLAGGFNAYTTRLVDRSLGFAIAWNYCINWFTVLPLEMVTASMTIKYWNTSINSDVWVAIFFPMIVAVNFIGSAGYAEAEFWLNLIKVSMLLTFIVVGLIVVKGGAGSTTGDIGVRYFQDPGLFANGFKGVCAAFVTSTFSLGGTEFMALTAADQRNPRKAIPTATKQVFYRLLIFYFLSIFVVTLLVPYNSPLLMGSGENNGAPVSPYVIAMTSHGVVILPHVINAVILIAVLSVGNAALYSSSRTFYALAKQGFAPKWFDFVDKKNRPTRAMLVSSIIGLFSFIASYKDQEAIFTWLLSLSGLSTIFTWSSICVCHIRFRAGLRAQGKNLAELGYIVKTGVWTSYIAIILNMGILAAQFWVSLYPIGGRGADVVNFFQNYLGMFSFLLFYIGHKIYLAITDRQSLVFPFIKATQIDLDTDRKVFDPEQLQIEASKEREAMKNAPMKKVLNFFF